MKKRFTEIYYSFPIQLMVLHLRSNLLLLAIWMLFTLFMMGNIGLKFGLRYLFLSPEYLGDVGFWSFFYLGVGFGAFFMSWNLTTYLLEAKYFSFLASLSRPFTKFCINNFVIPLIFIVLFLINLIHFGFYHEYLYWDTVLVHILGFFSGIFSLVILIAVYFNYTNKDILSYRRYTADLPPNIARRGPQKRTVEQVDAIKQDKNQRRVDTYLNQSFKPRLVRSVAHYDRSTLLRVFKQNHTNALLVQLFSLVVLVLLGIMIERPSFRVPTGTSIFLLGSIVAAITGAVSYWFQRWRMVVLLVLGLLINELTKFQLFHHENRAYGLNYNKGLSEYSYDNLEEICDAENVRTDLKNAQQILDNWQSKMHTNQTQKPKMVFYCVSGGGLKATAWSMRVLQHADSLTNGNLMDHTILMSGASGGMIGSAYYRELYLQQQKGEIENRFDAKYLNNVSQDLLNPISFTIVTNDLFIPWATFERNGKTYHKDRGYILEKQLNENTDFAFEKTLKDYQKPEFEAKIPMMFLTPSIVNDGRRMMISSQKVSYMMAAPIGLEIPESVEIDAVDFQNLFANQEAENLSFSTAIRMNATYPYILPNVALPTRPEIEVLDAGFRDNFGLKSAIRFAHVFKDWIQENTSGVVFVIVRAYDREKEIKSNDNAGFFDSLFDPLGIAGKILSLQDYEHDTNLGFLYDVLGKDKMDIVRLTYRPSEELKDAPISFHITERQRRDIIKAVGSTENRESLNKLEELLKH